MPTVAAPTVEEILTSELSSFTPLWAAKTPDQPLPGTVVQIYRLLRGKRFDPKRVMVLEFSCYLEHYLLPFLEESSPPEHLLSIVMLVNEKFREGVPAWEGWSEHSAKFHSFFVRVLSVGQQVGLLEKTMWLQFLINCFQSLEQEFVRAAALKVTNVQAWWHLNVPHRTQLLSKSDKLRKVWRTVAKRYAEPKTEVQKLERDFLASLLERFLVDIEKYGGKQVKRDERLYCERFLELLIDLLNQLPTRRFFVPLLTDKHFVVRCSLSAFAQKDEARLFNQLLEMLRFYEHFEIDDSSGNAMSAQAVTEQHYARHDLFQRVCFKKYDGALQDVSIGHVSRFDQRKVLVERLRKVPLETMKSLTEDVCYLSIDSDPVLSGLLAKVEKARAEAEPQKKKRKKEESPAEKEAKHVLTEILVCHLERRLSQMDKINQMPLMPTEDIIWDPNLIPAEQFRVDYSLALPKLNLQFLTIHDYLLRNFTLYRLESTYEIRGDLEDALKRMRPTPSGFKGHARMAVPVAGYSTTQVKKPKVGETVPAEVLAEISFSVAGLLPLVKREWDQLREHDVIFLVAAHPDEEFEGDVEQLSVEQFPAVFGIQSVRGVEVYEMLDEEGNVMTEGPPDQRNDPVGTGRTIRVKLDAAQYHLDMERGLSEKYTHFNMMLKRRAKENNFKSVLSTIRTLLNSKAGVVIPMWLHDLFLGYGDPGSAQFFKMDTMLHDMDWRDTFLDRDHLLASFPDADEIEIPDDLAPPYELKFTKVDEEDGKPVEKITVSSYGVPNMGPYPRCLPRLNTVRFTETQVRAIRSGANVGLTMIVGPPGTGKTDTAVQTVNLIYHNNPDEKILLVAHSNQALNDLFEKIVKLDIPEHYLLRLGRGGEELGLDVDYSKWGRVNHMLQRRIDLLKEVEQLAQSLGIPNFLDVAYSCDNAQRFFLHHVQSRWERYEQKMVACEGGKKLDEVHKGPIDTSKRSPAAVLFPFDKFFKDAPQPLFPGTSFGDDAEIAQGCWRYIRKLFTDVDECHAFELLRNMHDRCNYLVTKHSRIIALTCTHAALTRDRLVDLQFRYDSLIMEESAQVLEVETLIPMLLQQPERGVSRLKRVVLIGDHHQLPPVIKNHAIQKYGKLDQSMFARFVRLRVPTIDLNLQGRARPSIASLYNWRYRDLGDLQAVLQGEEYLKSNPGLTYDYQFVNVENFQGRGETQPNPYFYQNLGEAEFVVAMFMYLRLKGYPANKITILSTYNGQKHLLRDVLRQRCAWNPLFGEPSKVTTVDRFQGQQNDYILISLVRTEHVGHIRDVRRLVVAASRARLGLYIFGRLALYQNCFEIAPTFRLLAERPAELSLELAEKWPVTKRSPGQVGLPMMVRDVEHMWALLQACMQQSYIETTQEAAEKAAQPEAEEVDMAAEADGAKAAEGEEAKAGDAKPEDAEEGEGA